MTVRWGVAGLGPVADKVMRDLVHVPDAVLTAVGSRSAERARAFAVAHAGLAGHGQVPAAHGSYRALLADPGVDVVYVATPHPQHRALALAALAAGKAILVEKSFTVTPAATREVAAAARIVLHRVGCDPETIDLPPTGVGYTHELTEVTERVAGGHTESEVMPLADTVAVQDVLAEIARQVGLRVAEGPADLP